MQTINLNEFQENLAKLVELAGDGEEIIIIKDHKPFVKLVPAIERKRQRQFGSARGLIKIAEDFDEPIEDFNIKPRK